MCEQLLESLKVKSNQAENELSSIGQINNYLTSIIEKQDKKLVDFENSNDALQRYKHMVKCVTMMNCKGCDQVFTPQYFSSHTGVCQGLVDQLIAGIEVKVMEAIRSNEDGWDQGHYEYKIWVSYCGTHWYVFKRMKHFIQLSQELNDRGITRTEFNPRDTGSEHHYHLPLLQEYMYKIASQSGV